MKTSSPIDLSLLPAPEAIEEINFEQILAERKSALLQQVPPELRPGIQVAIDMDSEPLAMLLQENSYREMLLRERINERVRRVLLAFAKRSDLDHIAARYYIERLVVQPEDLTSNPPKPLIMESDEALRERIQDAYEGLSTAGPRGAYVFHARSADGRVVDALAVSPEPCDIVVYVLSSEGDGTASAELLNVVFDALNDEEIRPVGDRLTVLSSQIVRYSVRATLTLKSSGPGGELALAEAVNNIKKYVKRRKRQGQPVWRNFLEHLMYVEGVEHVSLHQPSTDLLLTEAQAGCCVEVDINLADPPGTGA